MQDIESGPGNADRKGIWGWMFFDWAAQPFFTVVTTFVFGPYIVSRMVDDPTSGQTAWATGIAVAGFIIAILSPILGSIADKSGPRKPWIAFFAFFKVVALFLLWFAAPGSNVVWVLGLFIMATVAAEFSIVFNDSMMSYIVAKKDIGRVSNTAWGLGYLGGMIVLILVLLFLAGSPSTGLTILGIEPLFGLDPMQSEGDRAAAPLAALWYLVFVLPMFLFTPDKNAKVLSAAKAVTAGLKELGGTIRDVRQKPGIFSFLIARMIYQDGVAALLALGGAFAAGMFQWETMELGLFGIILNIVAIPSCIVAGRLDSVFGSKRVVMFSILLLILATIGIISTGPGFTLFGLVEFQTTEANGLFSTPAEMSYIIFGLLIGIAFGPAQASSRSYLARSVPTHETGRYFGLYALAGRATSFAAPAMVAIVTASTGSERMGMAVIILFFIVGAFLLAATPYPAADTEPNR
ncbi:MAG: MFS transporter [Rhizobiaceae bacterium]|jgi:UMF1 family MFS transporter|nr:MFS transporter [Rhizobiaceae bacterium]